MVDQELDFYQNLRVELRDRLKAENGSTNKLAEYLMFAPDLLHLLCRLSLDEAVPLQEKAKLAAAIAYFVSPIDLVPGLIFGPVAAVDDIALAAYVINSIINNSSPEIVEKHWAGEGDVLALVKGILEAADRLIGTGALGRLLKRIWG
jgi:uncharacterized membrane protein YkvA (DUF1232 family)